MSDEKSEDIKPEGGNGEMNDIQRMQAAGMICGRCKFAAGLMVPIIPPQDIIARPKKPQGMVLCVCGNPKSPEYARLNHATFSCVTNWEELVVNKPTIVSANDIPKKIVDRMKLG